MNASTHASRSGGQPANREKPSPALWLTSARGGWLATVGMCVGCMKDSAGKFCLDIMQPRAVANVQKETEDVWAGARVQAMSVAASGGCEPD